MSCLSEGRIVTGNIFTPSCITSGTVHVHPPPSPPPPRSLGAAVTDHETHRRKKPRGGGGLDATKLLQYIKAALRVGTKNLSFFREHFCEFLCEVPKKPLKYFNFFFLWTFYWQRQRKKAHYIGNGATPRACKKHWQNINSWKKRHLLANTLLRYINTAEKKFHEILPSIFASRDGWLSKRDGWLSKRDGWLS